MSEKNQFKITDSLIEFLSDDQWHEIHETPKKLSIQQKYLKKILESLKKVEIIHEKRKGEGKRLYKTTRDGEKIANLPEEKKSS